MRLIFLGSGAFGVPTLKRLISEHTVSLVITQPDRPAGRHREMTPTPVAQIAAENSIQTIKPENVNGPAIIHEIANRSKDVQAWVVIAFGQKLSRPLLDGVFAINLHASLLPKYRGAAPINWAMINGEAETGLSVITIAYRMDAGDVLGQAHAEIDPGETAGELHDRLSLMGPDLMLDVLERHSDGNLDYRRQDERLVTRARKLTKADGTVCFDQPAPTVRNRVHGLTPWPGCWVRLGERSLRFHRVEVVSGDSHQSPPGTLLNDMAVACASTGESIRLLDVQPANGKLMTFQAYCNGHGVRAGERFRSA